MTITTYLTHHLDGGDRAALAAHFLTLGDEDRRLRFGAALNDDAVGNYVNCLDFEQDVLYAVRDDDSSLLGVVHIAGSGAKAELGLSVLPAVRGRGIGSALFERAVTHLRNRNVATVFVHCLAENQAMMHIAAKQGMQLVYAGSENDGYQLLSPPTASTYLSEWTQDQQAEAMQSLRDNMQTARRLLLLFMPPNADAEAGKTNTPLP